MFADYETALGDLAVGRDQATVLRRFEVRLLAAMGYALPLVREADTGAPVDPAARYHYAFDRGPQALVARAGAAAARGARNDAARAGRATRIPMRRPPPRRSG